MNAQHDQGPTGAIRAAADKPEPSSLPDSEIDLADDDAPGKPAVFLPLEALGGQRPPAPAWFAEAMAHGGRRSSVTVAGAEIELLSWGDRGRPGLLFLPGMGAAAAWWEPVVPYFADRFHCAALSWSGMGRSDWREHYSMDLFADELDAAIAALGLDANGALPLIVAHSYGTMIAARWAERQAAMGPGRVPGMVLVDRIAMDPEAVWQVPVPRSRPARRYPSLTAALLNFRLSPPQPCDNLFLVDHVAREGLRRCEAPGEPEQWMVRYDVAMRTRMTGEDQTLYGGIDCPIAFIWGARSPSMTSGGQEFVARRYPAAPNIVIPESGHHIMLDQPLALTAALRALLECWPPQPAA